MSHSRRGFLSAGLTLVAVSAFGAARQMQQQNGPQPQGPLFPQDSIAPLPPARKPDPRVFLKENQKEIKKDVKRLSEAVAALQKSLDENDTEEVLSLDVLHKTEEIEKLAKHIRSLVKG
jgi:hypothetical protein